MTNFTPITAKQDDVSDDTSNDIPDKMASKTGRELVNDFCRYYQREHDFKYNAARGRDDKTMQEFAERFPGDAGYMVKFLFDKWHGRKKDGEPASISFFTAGCKWMQDILYHEYKSESAPKAEVKKVEGLINGKSILAELRAAKSERELHTGG